MRFENKINSEEYLKYFTAQLIWLKKCKNIILRNFFVFDIR